jgi:hypothetical protein
MRGRDSLLCFELSSPHNYATALQAGGGVRAENLERTYW